MNKYKMKERQINKQLARKDKIQESKEKKKEDKTKQINLDNNISDT